MAIPFRKSLASVYQINYDGVNISTDNSSSSEESSPTHSQPNISSLKSPSFQPISRNQSSPNISSIETASFQPISSPDPEFDSLSVPNRSHVSLVFDSSSDSEEEQKTFVHKELLFEDSSESQDPTDDVSDSKIQVIFGQKELDEPNEEQTFYVKFSGKSHIHNKFLSQLEIEQIEGGSDAFRKFQKRLQRDELVSSMSVSNLLTFQSSELNSEWFEIDRIIDEKTSDRGTEFLVKWKNLPYCDSTWELAASISDQYFIDLYYTRKSHSNPKKISSRYIRPSIKSFKPVQAPVESNQGDLLRDYQLDGVNWMLKLWYENRNNILADEMGLGKTAQLVCFLNQLKIKESISGPFLVIAPLSTLAHWQHEFEVWSDLNTII